jgi:hypothetical protein
MRGLAHIDNGGGSADIFGGILGRRIVDQAFSAQSQQQFVAGHVLEPATGMNLVPVFAQFPGNMDTAFVPVFIDHCLDKRQILGDKFAVSDE